MGPNGLTLICELKIINLQLCKYNLKWNCSWNGQINIKECETLGEKLKNLF